MLSVAEASDLCQIIVCYLQGLNGSSRTLQSLQQPAIRYFTTLFFCSAIFNMDSQQVQIEGGSEEKIYHNERIEWRI